MTLFYYVIYFLNRFLIGMMIGSAAAMAFGGYVSEMLTLSLCGLFLVLNEVFCIQPLIKEDE